MTAFLRPYHLWNNSAQLPARSQRDVGKVVFMMTYASWLPYILELFLQPASFYKYNYLDLVLDCI